MRAIKIENVMIFPEKMEFLINRGMRSRVFTVNQGRVMVRLKGFENYYLCLKSGEIFSKRKDNKMLPLKKEVKGGTVYYRISINGVSSRVPLFQIFRENLSEIQQFFKSGDITLNTKTH